MKTANMNPQDYSRYQDEQVHEHFERLERESSIRKAAEDVKKAQSQGKTQGLAEGEAKSKVETLKKLLEMNQDYNLTLRKSGIFRGKVLKIWCIKKISKK